MIRGVRINLKGVRLMPAAMVTMAVVLGLKTVALAETAAEGVAEGLDLSAPAGDSGGTGATAPAAPAAAAPPGNCPTPGFAEQAGLSPEEVQVLQALGARREALDARSADLDTQAQVMAAAEQRIGERLTELRALETQVAALLGQLDEQEEQRLARLVNVYERMRSRDAAEVMNQLEMPVLLEIAQRMRPQNLAEIMGRMDPARARELSIQLAAQAEQAGDAQALLEQARGGATTP